MERFREVSGELAHAEPRDRRTRAREHREEKLHQTRIESQRAIQEHPAVQSCAVIGLPDEDKGAVIHAILEADSSKVGEDELKSFLAERLVVYKIPRTFEYVDFPLRGDDGKVRRSALRAERVKE